MNWYFVAASSPTIGYGHVSRLRLLANETKAAFPNEAQTLVFGAPTEGSSSPWALPPLDPIRTPAIVVIDGPDSFVDAVTSHTWLRVPSVLVAAFRMYGVSELTQTLEDVSLVASFTPTRMTRSRDGERYVYSGKHLILVRKSMFISEPYTKPTPPRVLVSMGSADPADLTSLAAEALYGLEERFQIMLVLGTLNARADQLTGHYSGRFDVVRQQDVDFDSMLKSASIAVVSGGLTRYECIAAKTPFVSISLNQEQAKYTSAVTEAGFGVHAGIVGQVSPDHLRAAFLKLGNDEVALERMRHAADGMLSIDNALELARFLRSGSDGNWGSR